MHFMHEGIPFRVQLVLYVFLQTICPAYYVVNVKVPF